MKNLWIVFFLMLVWSCSHKKNKRTDAFDFIPENTSFIIDVKNPEAINTNFEGSHIIKSSSNPKEISPLRASIKLMEQLKTPNNLIVAFAKDSINYSVITPYKDSLITAKNANFKSIGKSTFKKHHIDTKIIANDTLFVSVIDSFLIISNTIKQIEKSISNENSSNFDYLRRFKSDTPLSIHIISDSKIASTDSSYEALYGLNNQSLFDMDIAQDYFSLSGIRKSTDSSSVVRPYFDKSLPNENKLPHIIPNSTKRFISFTANNFDEMASKFLERDTLNLEPPSNTLSDLINEIGTFNMNTGSAFAIRSIDIDAIKESINSVIKETFRQINIYDLEDDKDIRSLFLPLINITSVNYYVILDDFIIFTETLDHSRDLISSYSNKSTLNNSGVYKSLQDKISDEASILYFSNASVLDSVLSTNLPYHLKHGLLNTNFNKNHTQVLQVINDHGFAHVNVLIQDLKEKAPSNSISEVFNIALNNELLHAPQLLKNHVNGQMDILVQDIENTLYLISNRGKIL